MRYLLIGIALLAILIGGAWYGGETLLSQRVTEAIRDNDQISAGAVAPIRDPSRMGLRLRDVEIGDAETGMQAPQFDVYAPALSPNTVTVALPAEMTLRQDAVSVEATVEQGIAAATISPTHGMAVREAVLTTGAVGVDGLHMADRIAITARLVHRGRAAPAGTGAAYLVDLLANGMRTAPGIAPLSAKGEVLVWLSSLPGRAVAEGRVPPPTILGLETAGIALNSGALKARLVGRVEADADGFARGEVALYSTDAEEILAVAAETGLLPDGSEWMAGALLNTVGERAVEAATEKAPKPQLALVPEEPVTLPPPVGDEVRLTLRFEDATAYLGPVELGPAPRMVTEEE